MAEMRFVDARCQHHTCRRCALSASDTPSMRHLRIEHGIGRRYADLEILKVVDVIRERGSCCVVW
eukprot:2876587-Rhodomonas_salina.1